MDPPSGPTLKKRHKMRVSYGRLSDRLVLRTGSIDLVRVTFVGFKGSGPESLYVSGSNSTR